MKVDNQGMFLTTLKVRPIMVEWVKEAQRQDARLSKIVEEIMEEAYYSAYSMHPDSTKIYRTLKDNYWW